MAEEARRATTTGCREGEGEGGGSDAGKARARAAAAAVAAAAVALNAVGILAFSGRVF